MQFEVLHIVKHENRRAVVRDDLCGIEKQRALGIAQETVCTTESVLLRYARDRERLAREAREQDIVPGYPAWIVRIFADVACERVVVPEVCRVGLPRPQIAFGRESAATADPLEADAKATDACEQIDEAEYGPIQRWLHPAGLSRGPRTWTSQRSRSVP